MLLGEFGATTRERELITRRGKYAAQERIREKERERGRKKVYQH